MDPSHMTDMDPSQMTNIDAATKHTRSMSSSSFECDDTETLGRSATPFSREAGSSSDTGTAGRSPPASTLGRQMSIAPSTSSESSSVTGHGTTDPSLEVTMELQLPSKEVEQACTYILHPVPYSLQRLHAAQEVLNEYSIALAERQQQNCNKLIMGSEPDKRYVTVNDLCLISGQDPPNAPEVDLTKGSDEDLQHVRYVFDHTYARPLDLLFETAYFSTHGWAELRKTPELLNSFGGMLELFKMTTNAHYEIMSLLPSNESRMAWRIMQMPRHAGDPGVANGSETTILGLDVLLHRVKAFELLLTGQSLDRNPFVPPDAALASRDKMRARQLGFWHTLGQFIMIHDPEKPPERAHFKEVETALGNMRHFLDGRESRDVMYSIATLRYLAGKKSPLHFPEEVTHNTNSLKQAAFDLAKSSLEDEASAGTNQIFQRISAMALRKLAMDQSMR
ncbi:MAG: hypothetical protein M1828_004452 [Chrysothrix sp. TS-e1954]|nr:MAG: hypothetical protein M1828_004452 [Chrysothrix sp. TS-e1954]